MIAKPFWNQIEKVKFTDSYRIAVEKWRRKILDKTRRTILGSFEVKKEKKWIDHWDHPMS